jgi:hypothetical protein
MFQQVEIFRAPFLPAGTKIEFSRETSRVKLYLDDLSRVVPRLAKLRSCEVIVVIDRDQGIKEFVVLLREVRHSDLFSSTLREPLFLGKSAFLSEVDEVKDSIAKLRPLISSALSAGITAASARELFEANSPEATIRGLFFRRRGLHVLSGYTRPPDTSTYALFAQGVPATIRACVASIQKRRVRLVDVFLVDHSRSSLLGVDVASKIWLTGISDKMHSDEALTLFRHSQSGKQLQLDVVLAFDLAGGHVHCAEFRRIGDN